MEMQEGRGSVLSESTHHTPTHMFPIALYHHHSTPSLTSVFTLPQPLSHKFRVIGPFFSLSSSLLPSQAFTFSSFHSFFPLHYFSIFPFPNLNPIFMHFEGDNVIDIIESIICSHKQDSRTLEWTKTLGWQFKPSVLTPLTICWWKMAWTTPQATVFVKKACMLCHVSTML